MASTSPKANTRRKEAAELVRLNDELIIKALCESLEGRRWLWNQLQAAQSCQSSGNFDHAWMAYREGLRNQGLKLLSSITRYCPEAYLTMTRENAPKHFKEPEDDRSSDTSGDDSSYGSSDDS